MNISIIIPIRIDNSARLNNLNHCLSFIKSHFPKAEVIVIESAGKTKLENTRSNFHEVKFHFLENKGRFSKSDAVNYGIYQSSRSNIAIWDVDVIIHPGAIEKACRLITEQKFRVILPHNTIFVNIKGNLLEKFVKNFDFSLVPYVNRIKSKKNNPEAEFYSIPSGVVIFEKEALMNAGGYNRNMISYGWEDIEVLKRLNKLGHHYYIMGGYNVIHLHHPRGIDSKVNTFYDKNKQEYYKVLQMKRKELVDYIRNTLYSDYIYNVAPPNDVTSDFSIFFNIVFLKCIFSRIKHKILTTI